MEEIKNIFKKPVFSTLLVILTIYLGIISINALKENQYIGEESRNNITVSGTGEVYTQPDLALINLSIVTEKETVSEAMSENTEKMNNIIEEVKNQGIEEKDLKTTNFSVYPRYEWHEATEEKPQGERVLVGYEVNQTLEVKIRDLEKISIIIDKATEKGANQVSNLQFIVENEDSVRSQAREEAIKEAKSKAEDISSQLGVKLVKITSFNEGYISSPRFYDYAIEEAAGKGGGSSIETGENKIEVNVSITYEIE